MNQNKPPIVVYDNQCYLCIKFAKFVNFLSQGKFMMIGHYSEKGEKIRNQILDKSALEMFWYIDGKIAYGGRAALFPLIKGIFVKKKTQKTTQVKSAEQLYCKNSKAVFLRSASLFSNSKKISFEKLEV